MQKISRAREKICIKCGKHFWGLLKTKKCFGCNLHKEQKKCDWCGKDYYAKSGQKYCCNDCRNSFHRKFSEKKFLVREGKIPRFKIFERDNFRCVYCGRSPIEDGIKLHVDHIIPVYLGGESIMENLITSCDRCNISKSARILDKKIVKRLLKRTQ